MKQEKQTAFEPNTTQVPNFIFEILPHVNETELKLLLVVIRKTYGWHKEKDEIAGSQLQALTGCGLTALKRARRSLEQKGILKIKRGDGRKFTVYHRPHSGGSLMDAQGGLQRPGRGVAKDPAGGSPADPTKDTITKDTKQKTEQTKMPSSSRPEPIRVFNRPDESLPREEFLKALAAPPRLKTVTRLESRPQNMHDAFRGAVV